MVSSAASSHDYTHEWLERPLSAGTGRLRRENVNSATFVSKARAIGDNPIATQPALAGYDEILLMNVNGRP
jgi:hypothetical protein